MHNAGDAVLALIQYADTFELKRRPAVVLYSDMGNTVVAGVTSNIGMQGIPLTKKEGALKDSVIKLNYIFTISDAMVEKVLFTLSKEKQKLVYKGLIGLLSELNSENHSDFSGKDL
jgi:mRNA-degrading endonuclease toxin of MazEF toxin-antitoxin module